MWKLQDNIFDRKSLKKYANFLISNKQLTQGAEVAKFEKNFSKWNNSKYSVLVNSGSSANLLIIFACKEFYGWNNSDEIIVPSLTWPTTVTPVIQSGLKPIFIDTNFTDLSFDYTEIEKKITKKTKAIFVAHILGFPANMEVLTKLAKKYKLEIIEDCCESIGAKFNKKKVGNFGIAGSFSFYWGHHISTIEGGMITTNNEKFYNLLKLKRSHGFARELPEKLHKKYKKKFKEIDFRFLFLTDGFNVRSTNLNAYIGIDQLKKINSYIKIRNKNYKFFLNLIEEFKENLIIIKPKNIKNISSFAFPLIFKEKKYLPKFKKLLLDYKIEYRSIIAGNLLKQPFLKNRYTNKCKNSDIVNERGIYLGNNQFVDKKKIYSINKIFRNIFNYTS